MAASSPKVLIMMADYGHDPTETAVPYTAMKAAGFHVQFATENGKSPQCDKMMLEGVTQKLLGASRSAIDMYATMSQSDEMQNPLSWSASGFSLESFDLVFFPGGHEKSVRKIIDSLDVHELMADYFPKTKKPGKKAVAAVCHGVMVLSESKDAAGNSVIRDCVTTALPARFEQVAFWGTRAFLGDYYKTYGAGSENVEQSVTNSLANATQFKNSLLPTPFVVQDEQYNYISARFPGDADLFAQKIVKLVQSLKE
ncbi:class I glutamine amidotransferase-like protein [Pseudomassariella vexata]|uniref:Class I glutamine amidotransferase-like protein n=1 Tax=Pseudomassariella vexata TaxID=1141098 RepID=A0A1Y2DPF0_9PEZI|nr:class I glutamine amidotransferase-like protein [Pseudomassariella vexata]ORY60986.1 class I glutamine amidotransferase-like protein [Pseudomassariella vexata]